MHRPTSRPPSHWAPAPDMRRLSLDQLHAVVEVVRLGSFSAAADKLGVSTTAASRHVAELEAHLQTRLLNRTTRRVSLTESGRATNVIH